MPACAGAWRCAARRAASPSTTTSRTTRPRSARRSRACASASAQRAHPRRARAALEHDEARRDEGRAAGEPRARPIASTSTARASAGMRPRCSRRWARGRAARTTSTHWSARGRGGAAPGDHVLVMSNGGFGGIHEQAARPPGERPVIVYLHGFNSSPQSHKAKVLGDYLAQRGLALELRLPGIAAARRRGDSRDRGEPAARRASASSAPRSAASTPPTWPRSSGARAVLINPAIDPHVGLRAYLGPQKNLYTGEPYELTEAHLQRVGEARRCRGSRRSATCCSWRRVTRCSTTARPSTRYAGAEQVVVQGGDHSLQSFPRASRAHPGVRRACSSV